MLIDSHAHFHANDPVEAILQRAREQDVGTVVAVGGSCDLNKTAVTAAQQFPDQVAAAIGFDRDQSEELVHAPLGIEDAVDRLRFSILQFRASACAIAAIGEIGLDYHYHPETANDQVKLFEAQLALATELRLPVIVHSREATEDTLRLLAVHHEQWGDSPDRIGVLHCFTGDKRFAAELVDLGFCISFSGIVTFSRADELRQVAAGIPDEKLLIETDSPYLSPVPVRGQRNEPAYLRHTAKALAEVRGLSFEQIADLTTRNTARLFALTQRPDSED